MLKRQKGEIKIAAVIIGALLGKAQKRMGKPIKPIKDCIVILMPSIFISTWK